MNKTIIININSIVFHIEEDAYETLRAYMIEIKKHFSQSADSGEILMDIENRIAEMFTERIQIGRKEVISMTDVNEVIAQMGRVSDFEDAEENIEEGSSTSFTEEQNSKDESNVKDESKKVPTEKKLMRNPDDKIIEGVCSGLGYYFGIAPKWVRLLFVLFFLFGGSGVLLYVVLWVVMPKASTRAEKMAMRGEEPNLQNFKKNFEEELENYKDGFSNARGHITNSLNSVGSGVGSVFSFVGKIIAFVMLITCGMVLVGMLITFVGFATGILGYQSDMVFPGTELFPTGQALIALFAGIMAITIPFIALFNLFLRILFKTGPMNTYFSMSLWAGWIVSIIVVLFFVVIGVREFKESSTIKVDKALEKQSVYHFTEKDVRVIEASSADEGKKKFHVEVEGEELSSYLRRDIHVSFEYLDSLETPYIQYNYFAKGKTRASAADRASHIKYLAHQEKGKIVFDSHFALPSSDIYRDQSVSVIVYLPIGSKVVIDESMQGKTWDVPYYDCINQYVDSEKSKETEWIMKKTGLVCAPSHIEQKKEEKKETKATDSE